MTNVIRETVDLRVSGRILSAELAYPSQADPVFAALLIGPHPYMGGSMQNVLMGAIASALANAGGVSLSFDYGGTGRSRAASAIDAAASMAAFWETGHAPEDPERFNDAAAALRYLESLSVRPMFVVGYSFGASVAWRLLQNEAAALAGVALVSPTLTRHEFPKIRASHNRHILVIHSKDDFCTPETNAAAWIRMQSAAVRYSCHAAGNHFFRGMEPEIGREVAEFVMTVVAQPAECVT